MVRFTNVASTWRTRPIGGAFHSTPGTSRVSKYKYTNLGADTPRSQREKIVRPRGLGSGARRCLATFGESLVLLFPHAPLPTAILALADGTVFIGNVIGATGSTAGEMVFNTALAGYQETLTDPASCGQIVTFTYPHIGNSGTNAEDDESRQVFAAGLVIQNLPLLASNFRSQQSLQDYLRSNGVVAIANIDTRKLTRHLRTHGSQSGCIVALPNTNAPTAADIAQAIAAAKAAPALLGQDLVKTTSCTQQYDWAQGAWQLNQGYSTVQDAQFHVVVYDLGVKRSHLRMLAEQGCKITVVPAQTPASAVLAMQADGVFFSNGAGDPQACDYAVAAARELMAANVPTWGLGLGHQIMALASGAKTFKLKVGHHGSNHPTKDLQTGRVSITSQNQCFAVEKQSLPANLSPTFISLFDGTVQGLERTDCPAFSVQGVPHDDMERLLDRFTRAMRQAQTSKVGATA